MGMLASCLVRTFLNPATQLRLVERFAEPFVRASDWVAGVFLVRLAWVWQPLLQFLSASIKRLASFL